MRARSVVAALITLVLAGCAGKERPAVLSETDDGMDAGTVGFRGVDAIPVRVPDCGGSEASLRRRRASAILVIDRSGSMNDLTTGATPVRKWQALVTALESVLPQVDQAVELGLLMFPGAQVGMVQSASQVCAVSSTLAVEPRYGNAATILAALRATQPAGGTPTSNALLAAVGWYLRATDRDGERYLILATDGGPNCLLSADPRTCRCSGPRETLCNPDTNQNAATNCVDETRPVTLLREAAQSGVPTYVLGLRGTENFADILDAMAIAGGRARTESPRYYSVASAPELANEFRTITSSIAECRFALNSAPPDPDLVDVRLDGASIYRDRNHLDGWDWSPANPQELQFYGRSCQILQAASGGSSLRAVFGCPAPTPP